MNNTQLIIEKTAAVVKELGWDRLEGLSTREALVAMRDSYQRLLPDRNPQKASLVREVSKLISFADQYGVN